MAFEILTWINAAVLSAVRQRYGPARRSSISWKFVRIRGTRADEATFLPHRYTNSVSLSFTHIHTLTQTHEHTRIDALSLCRSPSLSMSRRSLPCPVRSIVRRVYRETTETKHGGLHKLRTMQHLVSGWKGRSLAFSQGKVWHDFRSKVNPHMMQPRTVKAHVAQTSEVTREFVEKMRALRDPKSLELPNDFKNEILKWALECK